MRGRLNLLETAFSRVKLVYHVDETSFFGFMKRQGLHTKWTGARSRGRNTANQQASELHTHAHPLPVLFRRTFVHQCACQRSTMISCSSNTHSRTGMRRHVSRSDTDLLCIFEK